MSVLTVFEAAALIVKPLVCSAVCLRLSSSFRPSAAVQLLHALSCAAAAVLAVALRLIVALFCPSPLRSAVGGRCVSAHVLMISTCSGSVRCRAVRPPLGFSAFIVGGRLCPYDLNPIKRKVFHNSACCSLPGGVVLWSSCQGSCSVTL